MPAGFMNAEFIYDGQSNKFGQLAANYCSLQPVDNSYPPQETFLFVHNYKARWLGGFCQIQMVGSHPWY